MQENHSVAQTPELIEIPDMEEFKRMSNIISIQADQLMYRKVIIMTLSIALAICILTMIGFGIFASNSDSTYTNVYVKLIGGEPHSKPNTSTVRSGDVLRLANGDEWIFTEIEKRTTSKGPDYALKFSPSFLSDMRISTDDYVLHNVYHCVYFVTETGSAVMPKSFSASKSDSRDFSLYFDADAVGDLHNATLEICSRVPTYQLTIE